MFAGITAGEAFKFQLNTLDDAQNTDVVPAKRDPYTSVAQWRGR